ncbi:xylogen-like protein 11 [Ipomoea triloba]|uniref:xylogen-like protein 11 n=1 Tax=Ipomoea triloba TaxID=35885 RepID=UPI00125D0500|nr:xylogen-like protein 11 [Ipomoea triloba]
MAATKIITKIVATLLLVLVALAAAPGTEAQSPTASLVGLAPVPVPAGTFDCVNELINMSDCLTFVEAGSKLNEPKKACCPELAGMVETQPVCLCQLLADPENVIGFKIEMKKALDLPSLCKLNTPSTSLCSAIGIPVGAPTTTPAGKFPSSPGGGNNHDSAAIRSSVTFLKKSFLLGLAIVGFAALF